ncbi:MAG: MATE family efflux transporter [Lachnospiraceae bacterium]|nr:MATE family efflux transporter [Lachnospiraceae bacterium]
MQKSDSKNGMDRRTRLTTVPVPKLILELSVPTIISMLVTGIYNTADTYFVGQIPENATQATAAVGIVFPMMAIIQALGFFFGHGSGNFLSRMLGAGENQKASEMASTGFAMAVISGIIVAVICNIFIEPIAHFLAPGDVSPQTLVMTEDYARIILLGGPFMMAQFVINNQLRFQGSAMYAMVGLLTGAAMNMILDPLLILGLGLGVKGAAIATISGQISSFFVLLAGSRRGENIRLRFKDVHINRYYILEVINGGSPSLMRQGMAAISSMLLNRAAGIWGSEAAIAGMTIVGRIAMLLSCALIGFGQGYQPVCSFNYGAGLTKRVKEGYTFCVKWGLIFLAVVSSICFIFAPQVVSIFRDDPDVVAVGRVALRCQTVVLPLSALSVMSNMMLQSIGKGVKATITASARNGICFIPMILLLPQILGITGVEISQTVADVLTLLITLPLAFSELKKM